MIKNLSEGLKLNFDGWVGTKRALVKQFFFS